jgi:hypothetical protein
MWAKSDFVSSDKYVNLNEASDLRVSSPDSGVTWVIGAMPSRGGSPVNLAGTYASQAEAEAALADLVCALGYLAVGS